MCEQPTTTIDFGALLDQQMADLREREGIRCPKCSYFFDEDDKAEYVTTWGDGPPIEGWCPNCDAALLVTEDVSRTFDVTLQKEQDDE